MNRESTKSAQDALCAFSVHNRGIGSFFAIIIVETCAGYPKSAYFYGQLVVDRATFLVGWSVNII